MPSAADQLENVSYGILDPCTIDVSWWGSQVLQVSPCLKHNWWLKCSRIHLLRALPHLGPAVGRPADPVVQGQSLEAVRTWVITLFGIVIPQIIPFCISTLNQPFTIYRSYDDFLCYRSQGTLVGLRHPTGCSFGGKGPMLRKLDGTVGLETNNHCTKPLQNFGYKG